MPTPEEDADAMLPSTGSLTNPLAAAVDGLEQAVDRLAGFVPRVANLNVSSVQVREMISQIEAMHRRVADMVELMDS